MDGSIGSTGFCVVRPNPHQLEASYAFHWVKSPQFIDDMVRKATGASYPAVSDSVVLSSRLPLPPLGEQQRIAAILDKADGLRAKRHEALAHLDSLRQSIFNEMFGDLNNGRPDWGAGPLSRFAEVVSGITKGRRTKAEKLRKVPYLAVSNVQDKRLDLNAVKTIDATDEEIERLQLRHHDLLLTEGGDPDKLGRGTLWNEELPIAIHQNHVFRVRVTDSDCLHPLFLNWLTGSDRGRAYFLRSAKQTTGIASINKTQLSAFPLLLPPIELQREFADRVTAVERLKEHHRAQLSQLDALFASLQHRAFKGEL
ncbi:restriction endonuclease subunit S [Arthrobacter sp. JZ12]|uniref:restriction endonuclease subunit S n=1 Tax=Arthrobacter sp. JZ12 TaxID=2654190 RepID=UPI002B47A760|nr:restriction endonuclease subunit S [Arthrobacter sp. JZ12]